MKNIKKTDIALILGVVIVLALGFIVMKGNKNSDNKEYLTKLSYLEYQEKIDNGDKFMFIVERTTCSHCQNFMPVAKKFAKKYKIKVFYIDTDEMSEEDWSKFETSNTFFEEHKDEWGTPTTIILEGNKSLEYIEGETDESSLKELYDKYFEEENE